MNNSTSQSGFLKLLVVFVVFIALVSYFNINITDVVESKPVQIVWGWLLVVWEGVIEPVVAWLWQGTQEFFSEINLSQDVATTTVDVATTTAQ